MAVEAQGAKRRAGGLPAARPDDPTAKDILAAACALFLDRGFDGASLSDIATAAGVSRQTIYNRFATKDAILQHMMSAHWAAFERADQIPPYVVTDDLQTALQQAAARLIGFIDHTDEIAMTRLVISESRRHPWIGAYFFERGKRVQLEVFERELARFARLGKVECPDYRIAALQFLAMLEEFLIWPHVMAVGEALATFPTRETIVREAIATFMARYASPLPGSPRSEPPARPLNIRRD